MDEINTPSSSKPTEVINLSEDEKPASKDVKIEKAAPSRFRWRRQSMGGAGKEKFILNQQKASQNPPKMLKETAGGGYSCNNDDQLHAF